jgi:hypothetical protein
MAGYRVTFAFTVQQLAAKFALQVNIQGSVCDMTFLAMFYYNKHYILPNIVNMKHISAKG